MHLVVFLCCFDVFAFKLVAFLKYLQKRVSPQQFMTLFIGGISVVSALGLAIIVLLTYAGIAFR